MARAAFSATRTLHRMQRPASTACKNENTKCRGINRRKVVTIKTGQTRGERSISTARVYALFRRALCMAVCPVRLFLTRTDDRIVLHSQGHLCIRCGYLLLTPAPLAHRQYPQAGATSDPHRRQDGQNVPSAPGSAPRRTLRSEFPEVRPQPDFAEGKLPICAEMCSNQSNLLAVTAMSFSASTRNALSRAVWLGALGGWGTAYERKGG